MFWREILGRGPWLRLSCIAATLLATAGCGQRGPLYLPTDPAAANRATLPELLNPARVARPAPAPAAGQPGTAGRVPPPPVLDDEPLFGPSTGQANPVRMP